ncbi:hypothetical protein NDU88_006916 [Pleurodeles waltl]|uniref:Uncharacterized protein n=1 Tax=Pleurodeles waltl TaxID=8319 RepID=A0AAV7NVV7_PLEWA|nr:hypothetical protein NDU88_006916 [Pleurodeles waltl]
MPRTLRGGRPEVAPAERARGPVGALARSTRTEAVLEAPGRRDAVGRPGTIDDPGVGTLTQQYWGAESTGGSLGGRTPPTSNPEGLQEMMRD